MKLRFGLTHLTLLVALMAPALSWGKGPIVALNQIGTNWHRIIDELNEPGHSKIGDLDLNQLNSIGSSVTWQVISGAPGSVQSGSRQSAYYHDGDKAIHYSSSLLNAPPQSLAVLELHEVFRFGHFNDDNYALSTALNTLAAIPKGKMRDALANLYAQRYFSSDNLMAIGGTSISGGGDLITLTIKNQIIQDLLNGPAENTLISNEFLAVYPSIGFEPLQNPELHEVYVDYKYTLRGPKSGPHEFFSVFIPINQWKAGGSSRQAVQRDAMQKIVALFPVSPNSASRTFRPEGCSSTRQVVTYPITNDPAMTSIQNLRGSLQLGCQRFILGETDIEEIAPALPTATEPEHAGQSYFDCTFSYRGKTSASTNAVAYGTSEKSSNEWSLADDDFLYGEMLVSKEGELVATQIVYRPPGGTALNRVQNPAQPGGYGKSIMVISGNPLSYECRRRP